MPDKPLIKRLQEAIGGLVQDARGTKSDARFLSNFLTRPLFPVPSNIYDQFLPIAEYEKLLAEDPPNGIRRYWYEIDARLEHLRSSSHKLLRYYARKLLDTYKEPVASAPFLRSALETTTKAVAYHWAVVTAFNQVRNLPDGTIPISTELENLFLSYSHASKADLVPLLLSRSEPNVSLADIVREAPAVAKPKTPTVAKLIGICTFLDATSGMTIKYIYSVVCDITHAGSVCLALSDLITDPNSEAQEGGIYADYARALADAYPILCLEGLRCSFAIFRKYILDQAPTGRFLPVIEQLLGASAGSRKQGRDIQYPHIKPFLNGDQPLVLETPRGKIHIYP